ncbi:hypothetical protein BpHYR1_049478 [Brachionus plicatilis]|uniref:Uncharacterized protein n=1 Tax=Brachionus plicatilis TaxID=10195 RepID=A0A3M7RDJ9_BRAPC|nr:hypothetical protein BpHYR1_049478 [Brachionus plicatilis]
MFRFWRCLVGYNNGPTYGQVLKAYFSGKSMHLGYLVNLGKCSEKTGFSKFYLFKPNFTKIIGSAVIIGQATQINFQLFSEIPAQKKILFHN